MYHKSQFTLLISYVLLKRQAEMLAECFFLFCFFCSLSPFRVLYLANAVPTKDIRVCKSALIENLQAHICLNTIVCCKFLPLDGREGRGMEYMLGQSQPLYLSALKAVNDCCRGHRTGRWGVLFSATFKCTA